MYLVICMC